MRVVLQFIRNIKDNSSRITFIHLRPSHETKEGCRTLVVQFEPTRKSVPDFKSDHQMKRGDTDIRHSQGLYAMKRKNLIAQYMSFPRSMTQMTKCQEMTKRTLGKSEDDVPELDKHWWLGSSLGLNIQYTMYSDAFLKKFSFLLNTWKWRFSVRAYVHVHKTLNRKIFRFRLNIQSCHILVERRRMRPMSFVLQWKDKMSDFKLHVF